MERTFDPHELYERITSADPRTCDEALQILGAWLHRLAMRKLGSRPELAEECAQEALIDIWNRRDRVQTPGAFLGFCAKILHRRIVDALRYEGGTRPVGGENLTAEKQRRREKKEAGGPVITRSTWPVIARSAATKQSLPRRRGDCFAFGSQ